VKPICQGLVDLVKGYGFFSLSQVVGSARCETVIPIPTTTR
jgi:hypothetical protein